MGNNGTERKQFYVIQFIEIPFEGIDDYVCVPYTWVVIRRITDKKVVVAYPNNEDPFDTRDRAKRKERYNDDWMFYAAEVKYETDTYKDAEYWIATRNDGPLVEKDSGIEDTPPMSTSSKKLRNSSRNYSSKFKKDKQQLNVKTNNTSEKPHLIVSLKRPADHDQQQLDCMEQFNEKRLKLNKAAHSSTSTLNCTDMKPGCSKSEESIVMKHKAASSNNGSTSSRRTGQNNHRSSPVHQIETQQKVTPVIEVEKPIEVIDIDLEDHLQGERQPSEVNSSSQSHLINNTPASIAAPQPPMAAEQSLQSDQDDHLKHSQNQENSYSNFHPIITEVKSIREADNNQTARNDETPMKRPYPTTPLSDTLRMYKQIYDEMDKKQSLIQMHKPIEKRIRLENAVRDIRFALQNQTRPSQTKRQPSTVIQNQSQDVPSTSQHIPSLPYQRPSLVQGMDTHRNSPAQERRKSPVQHFPSPAANQPNMSALYSNQNNPINFYQEQQRQELLQRSTERHNSDHGSNQAIRISAHDVKLIPINIPNQVNSSSELSQQRQFLPSAQSNVSKSTSQINLQEIMQKLMQLEAKLVRNPIEQNPGSRAASRNVIPISTTHRNSSEIFTGSSYQSLGIPVGSLNENVHKLPFTQQQLKHRPHEVPIKRVHFEDTIVNPSAVQRPGAADDKHRTNENVIETLQSPSQYEASDSEAVLDHDFILDHEMFTRDSQVDTANNASTSTNNQPHSRLVSEQRMLDHFCTLYTQMGSNLYDTYELYKNLQGSILETADTYKKLLEVVERSFEASPSAALSSSDVASIISQVTEDIQAGVTKRGNSGSDCQYNDNVVNVALEKRRKSSWKIHLPPEYDPNNSKWTLKYQKMVPGLIELMPQSGIYVRYGVLKFSERVSNDCKTLAQMVLPEVFSKNALTVCSLLAENPKTANKEGCIERPPLDHHACAVLVDYVLGYGLQHGWNVDTEDILHAIDRKILENRN